MRNSESKDSKDCKNTLNEYYNAFEHFKKTTKKGTKTPKTQRALLCACAAILTKSLSKDQEQTARNYINEIKNQEIPKSQGFLADLKKHHSLKTHRFLAKSLSDFLVNATALNKPIEKPLKFIYD